VKSGTSDQTKQNDQSPYTYGRTDTPETKQGTHTHTVTKMPLMRFYNPSPCGIFLKKTYHWIIYVVPIQIK